MNLPASSSLVWIVIALFAGGALLESSHREKARLVVTAGWVLFGVFWVSLFPHFFFEKNSVIEGALSLVALPVSVSTAYLLYSGRDSLFVLSRAVAVMGIVYLPFELYIPAQRFLIMLVTHQTDAIVNALGYHPELVYGDAHLYQSTFRYTNEAGHHFETQIILACTGIGSMAMFAGFVAAVQAPLRRKLKALAVSVPVIWFLNVLRNVFVTLTFGNQWLQVFVDPTMEVVGFKQPGMVSFFYSHDVIAQALSIVALVVISWLVVRVLPETVPIVEDVLYITTRREFDLQDAFTSPKTD